MRWGRPRDQTVLLTRGGTVRASEVGSAFGTVPQAAPENALDGDLATSWQFGDFGNAVGANLDVRLPSARVLDRVVVRTAELGSVGIDRIRVTAGGRSRTADVDAAGVAATDLGGVRGRSVRITVVGLRGEGFNRVGIAEVEIPGVRVTRVARLPLSLTGLVRRGEVGAEQLRSTPLDVVLQRVLTRPDDVRDDEETGLERVVDLPDVRTFRPYGVLRPDGSVPERELDHLAGATGRVIGDVELARLRPPTGACLSCTRR